MRAAIVCAVFALAAIVVGLPVLNTLVDVRVTEAMTKEAEYHLRWLDRLSVTLGNDDAKLGAILERRRETEELKFRFGEGSLRAIQQDWVVNGEPVGWATIVAAGLRSLPRYWALQLGLMDTSLN